MRTLKVDEEWCARAGPKRTHRELNVILLSDNSFECSFAVFVAFLPTSEVGVGGKSRKGEK